MRKILLFLLLGMVQIAISQTKVGGIVLDAEGEPVAFANVLFKNSTEGTITNDNGRFYMESGNNHGTLLISFIGYESQEITLTSRVTGAMRIVLQETSEQLNEVVVYVGKTDKKNNPAIDILKKIWAKKRKNGLHMFKQYQYDKYEKIEFDLNTIDSALMKSRVFRGLEFVFDDLDTSRITGKTYLPIFLNETRSKVYGDNVSKLAKEDVLGSKNSGFSNNQALLAFIADQIGRAHV